MKKTLKKILALAMALSLALALTACGSSSDGESDTSAADGSADASAQQYVIGICQQMQHPALDLATEGFQDAVKAALGEENVTFDLQNGSGDTPTLATICNGFVSEGVDLIMANATGSLQAAVSATTEIPIVGTSVTSYADALGIEDFTGTIGGNVTGTSDLAPLDEQAAMIQELFPDAENIGLLYCSAESNSLYQVTLIKEYLKEMGYTCTEYSFADTNDVALVTQEACDNSDVIYIPTDNTAANTTATIDSVALPAGVPIVAGEEGICSGCGVATLSISYYDLGYAAGEQAVQILTGEADVSEVPVGYAANVTKEYVASRCETLGITIPDGYTAIEESEE